MSLESSYKQFEAVITETKDWLVHELATLRTGRVTPEVIESVPVEHYGARSPLNTIASISSADARSLVVSPWDPNAIPAISKALVNAELGVQPTVDGSIIRLVFPSLTEETRQRTIKQLHHKAEEARVRLRQGRDEALKNIKEEKQSGDLTEDDFYNGRKKLDEMIDATNAEMSAHVKKKEEDITTL